jgi:hypothetical protein
MQGTVHSEFVFHCQMINSTSYEEVLQHLREAIQWKRPEKWWNSWTLTLRQFLMGKKTFLCYHNQTTLPAFTVWLLAIPQIQRNNERKAIWHNWRHCFQHDMPSAGDSKRLPEMFPTVAEALEQVYLCWREVFWTGLMMKYVFDHSQYFLINPCMFHCQNARQNHKKKTDNNSFKYVAEFKYLGSTAMIQNYIHGKVKIRLN